MTQLSRPRRSKPALMAGAALTAVSLTLATPTVAQTASDGAATRAAVPEIVRQAAPSVVAITANGGDTTRPGFDRMPDRRQLDEFFRRFMDQGGRGFETPRAEARMSGTGSGFVVAPDGTIVTAADTIDGADQIQVTLDDGTTLPARVLGRDGETGLAVLRVDAGHDLPALDWGGSGALELGTAVIALGASDTYGTIVEDGIIAARTSGGEGDTLLVDDGMGAAMAGGPLLDTAGHVVGVVGAAAGDGGGNVWAVAADTAKGVVDELVRSGSVARGYLGVRIQPVAADIANALGLDRPRGALVSDVQAETPAASAGLTAGDVILSIDDQPVAGPDDLSRAVAQRDPGDQVRLGVWRGGETTEIRATLAALSDAGAPMAPPAAADATEVPELGLSLSELSPDARSREGLGAGQGVLVAGLDPNLAPDADLREGDVILSVQRQDVGSVDDVRSAIQGAIADGRSSVLLLVERDGARRFTTAPLARS